MTDITCNQVAEAATEYALGILPADETRAVSAHILGCAACRRQVDDISRIGDELLDLIPDAGSPLGFDQRVLSAVYPDQAPRRVWRAARLRVLVAAAAAAVIIVLSAVIATGVSDHRHPARPAELTAALHDGSRNVGSIYFGGSPAWISVTVSHLSSTGTVSCQLIYGDGTVVDIGTFELVDGSGTWGAPDPAGTSRPRSVRLVGPTGNVLATASFVAS